MYFYFQASSLDQTRVKYSLSISGLEEGKKKSLSTDLVKNISGCKGSTYDTLLKFVSTESSILAIKKATARSVWCVVCSALKIMLWCWWTGHWREVQRKRRAE